MPILLQYMSNTNHYQCMPIILHYCICILIQVLNAIDKTIINKWFCIVHTYWIISYIWLALKSPILAIWSLISNISLTNSACLICTSSSLKTIFKNPNQIKSRFIHCLIMYKVFIYCYSQDWYHQRIYIICNILKYIKSFMKILKIWGLISEPCGMPHLALLHSLTCSPPTPITTYVCLSFYTIAQTPNPTYVWI